MVYQVREEQHKVIFQKTKLHTPTEVYYLNYRVFSEIQRQKQNIY